MRISRRDPLQGVRFSAVEPGAVIQSLGGRFYIKMEEPIVVYSRSYNAVNLETGETVAFNPETKVVEFPDAVVLLHGEEDG